MTTHKDIQNLLASSVENTDLFDLVVETLRPYQGKPISKRLATAVAKALPSRKVSWRVQYGMRNIEIEVSPSDGFGHYSMLIDWCKDPEFRLEEFIERNRCYGDAAKDRNAKRRALMADSPWCGAVAWQINTINSASARLVELLDDNPESCALRNLVTEAVVS